MDKPIRYKIRGDLRNNGRECEILSPRGSMTLPVQVKFDDGTVAVVDRRTLRQVKQSNQEGKSK